MQDGFPKKFWKVRCSTPVEFVISKYKIETVLVTTSHEVKEIWKPQPVLSVPVLLQQKELGI